jgi:hypothetical protein
MNRRGDDDSLSSTDISRLQMKILAQLFRMIPTFNHIDDLFQWLAYTFSQQFNAQLIQLWANQVNYLGQRTAHLRTMVRRDTSIPEPVVVSEDVAQLAQRIAYEQRIYNPQAIDNLFPQYRVALLRRYGLNFLAGCFVYANLLLPPGSESTSANTPVPLAMTILLYLPRQPRFDFMPSISTIMNQAMAAAGTHGLLSPLARQLTTPRFSSEPALSGLENFIPHRKQDSKLMLSSNPLSSSTAITNKSARRLYSAIDGQSDMTTLCTHTGMQMTEAYAALQFLLTQQRVEIRSPSGVLIDPKFFLKDS